MFMGLDSAQPLMVIRFPFSSSSTVTSTQNASILNLWLTVDAPARLRPQDRDGLVDEKRDGSLAHPPRSKGNRWKVSSLQ